MRIRTILLTTTLATIAYAPHLSPQEAVSVTDSAGVRIVESSVPAWPAGAGWLVGTDPILTIGEVSGDLNYTFGFVSHALRLGDGSIVVADRSASELRHFGPDGAFIRSLGGRGEGPGEFAMLSEVWTRGDTILASDGAQGRVSVFGREGDVLETIRVESAQGRGGYRSPYTQFTDGAMLVLNPPSGGVGLGGGDVIPGAVWRLDRYSRDGRFMNEIAYVQESPRWEHGIAGLPPGLYLPFSLGLPPFAAGGNHVYTAGGTEAGIQRWTSDGELSHVFRWPIRERSVSRDDRRRWREANSTAPQAYNPAAWARYVREIPFPERMPLTRRLLEDAEGNLWAERFSPSWEEDSVWYVFNGEGVWLGEVAAPPGLHIFEIGANHVLGLRRDELGVPFVVMFPLDRGPDAPERPRRLRLHGPGGCAVCGGEVLAGSDAVPSYMR